MKLAPLLIVLVLGGCGLNKCRDDVPSWSAKVVMDSDQKVYLVRRYPGWGGCLFEVIEPQK